MRYSNVGRSNMTVSKICLGTMHFGNYTSEAEAFKIMDKCLEMGINYFDTANVYGGTAGTGATETILGKWFEQGGGRRDKVVLATKVYNRMVRDSADPMPNDEGGISAFKVRKQIADSLRRLKTDHVDLYQVHHIDRRAQPEEFWGTFDLLIANGDILYVGTSNFPGWGLAKYQMHAQRRGDLGIVSEQCQYNLLSRWPELEVIPAARDFGIGIMPYMPLGGGLLSGKKKAQAGSRTSNVEREYGLDIAHNKQLEEFAALCREIGEKEHIVAIAWVLANPAVYSAIVGARTLDHLDGLDHAAELALAPETIGRLNTIFDINHGRRLQVGEAPEAFAW
ncbi:MAG TPA: aldo/keto reductase [Spirochaetia bacterium]|nr:aldo/keto reductase [Spirochaetia bacterium]